MDGIVNRKGYCEDASRATGRVYSLTSCSNKAKYRITFDDNHTRDVCGTHLRQYNVFDYLTEKFIKEQFIDCVIKVEEIKTGKIIYEKVL